MQQVLSSMFEEQDALVAASAQRSATKDVSGMKASADPSPAQGKDFSLHDFSANVIGNHDSGDDMEDDLDKHD
jgi:hypothetical protein